MAKTGDGLFTQYLNEAYPRPALVPGEPRLEVAAFSSEQDSQLAIIEITQYAIYLIAQLLTLALDIAVTVSLVISIWRLTTHPDRSQLIVATVVTLGAIATGAAAVVVQKQANEARKRWLEVRAHRSGNAP